MARYLKRSGPQGAGEGASLGPVNDPIVESADVGDYLTELGPTAASGVGLWNTVQNKKVETSGLKESADWLWKPDDSDRSLDIWRHKPGKGISQFTRSWSDRLMLDKNYVDSLLNDGKDGNPIVTRTDVFLDLDSRLENSGINKKDRNKLLFDSFGPEDSSSPYRVDDEILAELQKRNPAPEYSHSFKQKYYDDTADINETLSEIDLELGATVDKDMAEIASQEALNKRAQELRSNLEEGLPIPKGKEITDKTFKGNIKPIESKGEIPDIFTRADAANLRAEEEIYALGKGDWELGSKLYRDKYGITDLDPSSLTAKANKMFSDKLGLGGEYGTLPKHLRDRIDAGYRVSGPRYLSDPTRLPTPAEGETLADAINKKYKAFETRSDLRKFKKDPTYKPSGFKLKDMAFPAKEELNEILFGGKYKNLPGYTKKPLKIPNLKNMRYDHVSGTMVPIKSKLPRNLYIGKDKSLTDMKTSTKSRYPKRGVLGKLGTEEGFFRNIGKGSVKDAWKGSKPGKIVGAFKNIGKGGFKDLWKGGDAAKYGKALANIGKGGLKSLFAPAQAATATTAASAAGPLAAMGPAGWTMLGLGLVGGKLFDKKTFLGKIFSDPRLKENIEIVGKSPSGVNVYEYDYKNVEGRYRGVLANEVPWASSYDEHGHLMVDYSKLDVDFIKVK